MIKFQLESRSSKPKLSESIGEESKITNMPLPQPAGPAVKTCCNCKKSQCLKFYCDCLAGGGFCGPDCGCVNCFNNEEHLKEREDFLTKNLDYHKAGYEVIETVIIDGKTV